MENQGTLKTEFEKLIDESAINHNRFYQTLKMSNTTWTKRLKQPSTFVVKEIMVAAKILRMTPSELFEIIQKNS